MRDDQMSPLRTLLFSAACAALVAGALPGHSTEARANDENDASFSHDSGGDSRQDRGYRSGVSGGEITDSDARRPAVSGFTRRESTRSRERAERRFEAGDERRDRSTRRAWRDIGKVENVYARHGSYVYALDQQEFFDVDDQGSGGPVFVDIDPAVYDAFRQAYIRPSYPSDTKVIDVETERLDRRPVGPDGIEVTYTGGAKIIRIAPAYRMGKTAEVASDTTSIPPLDLQPWSAGWLRHCSRTYHSFDPTLGTYVAEDGRVRFCER